MLPEIELDRIKSTYTTNDTRANYVAKSEASLWYERMGKFAEWVVDNGWKRVNFMTKDVKWYNTEHRRQASHAELINEFLNQLNEGK